MNQMIPNWLLQREYLTPHRTALVFSGKRWTFAELAHEARKYAGKLQFAGAADGMRVAILANNKPVTVFIIHALQQLGIEAVFLNHKLTKEELIFQLRDSDSGMLIYDASFSAAAEEMKTDVPDLIAVSVNRLDEEQGEGFKPRKEFALGQPCSIMYTSGTTGNPKGVIQTYGNHWYSAIGSALNLGLQEQDAWLCAVPIFHISGLSILMRSVIYGIPVYIMEQFSESEANRLLKSGEITIMSVVAAMLSRMLEDLGEASYHAGFRCMLLGGGPAPMALLNRCKEKGIPVFQTYGMTETASQVVTLAPEDSLRKLGSAGKPLFPVQIAIHREDRPAAAFEAGEISIKAPNITIGYLNRKEANEQSFKDGWFRTGDIGYLDEEGYLFILDRRSDLIISGGENVYPAEIENVLLSHPLVREAGVAGVEDPLWGKVPYAFIVPRKEVKTEDLFDFCASRLAKYKVPKRIIIVEALPRSGSNKLLRRELPQLIPEEDGQ